MSRVDFAHSGGSFAMGEIWYTPDRMDQVRRASAFFFVRHIETSVSFAIFLAASRNGRLCASCPPELTLRLPYGHGCHTS